MADIRYIYPVRCSLPLMGHTGNTILTNTAGLQENMWPISLQQWKYRAHASGLFQNLGVLVAPSQVSRCRGTRKHAEEIITDCGLEKDFRDFWSKLLTLSVRKLKTRDLRGFA